MQLVKSSAKFCWGPKPSKGPKQKANKTISKLHRTPQKLSKHPAECRNWISNIVIEFFFSKKSLHEVLQKDHQVS